MTERTPDLGDDGGQRGASDAATRPSRPRLVGVVHLPALPGSPRASLPIREVARIAAIDTRALAAAGFDLVMLENFGDAPFFAGRVPPITVAAMTACAEAATAASPDVPLGINVLRNDGEAALSIAAVVDAACIRVNVLTGARVTDQGLIQGEAATLLRLRRALAVPHVALWADVDVKHSVPLGFRGERASDGAAPEAGCDVAAEAKDTALRGLADALLVTGGGTGAAVDLAKLRAVRAAVPRTPVLVASGATEPSLPVLAQLCDGVIVGSALREGGVAGGRVDPMRAESFARSFRAAFSSA